MAIKFFDKIDHPREKLAKYGAGKLSDEELLAILLRTGPKGMNVINLSKKIVRQFRDAKLANATVDELKKVHGLGLAKACEIVACFELGRRLLKDKQTKLVISPQQVWEELKDIRTSKKEHFVIFFLNTQNEVQSVEKRTVSIGTLNSSLIHPREVFEEAIKYSCAHILLAHNHPSGSLEPSSEDLTVTKRLCDAGRLLGIEVIDHVIVTSRGYCSLKEKNLL